MFCPHQALPGDGLEGLCTLAAPSPLPSTANCSQQVQPFPCAKARELISLSKLPLCKGWVTLSPSSPDSTVRIEASHALISPVCWTWICVRGTSCSVCWNSCLGFQWATLLCSPSSSPSLCPSTQDGQKWFLPCAVLAHFVLFTAPHDGAHVYGNASGLQLNLSLCSFSQILFSVFKVVIHCSTQWSMILKYHCEYTKVTFIYHPKWSTRVGNSG